MLYKNIPVDEESFKARSERILKLIDSRPRGFPGYAWLYILADIEFEKSKNEKIINGKKKSNKRSTVKGTV